MDDKMMQALPKDARSKRKALLIGGGAPNATLIAGALVAMIEREVQYDVVSTSGAGALLGLLYRAPLGKEPIDALKGLVRMGVSDLIYDWLPVNYKVFLKPGPAADAFRGLMAMNPFLQQIIDHDGKNPALRLLADWLLLIGAAVTPSNVWVGSRGLCAHVPFAEEVIDFAAIPKLKGEFYINAYNVTQGMMEIWDKSKVTPDHFRAALAFPLIYPPYRIKNKEYIEGAAIDTINFRALIAGKPRRPANGEDDGQTPKSFLWQGKARQTGVEQEIDTLVVFDILGAKKLIQPPRYLYDAWVHSVITPLVEIARDDIKVFNWKHNRNPDGTPRRRLLPVRFYKYLDDADWPTVMDWSESNLQRLYDIGYKAGLAFCKEHANALGIEDRLTP